MPHNFKLTGTFYVSVDGDDSNNGTSKDTPKKTVQAGLSSLVSSSQSLIIGAGFYGESIYVNKGSLNSISVIGDGNVIISPPNKGNINFYVNNGSISNVHFKNYTWLSWGVTNGYYHIFGGEVYIGSFSYANIYGGVSGSFSNCSFINAYCDYSHLSGVIGLYSCILINTNFSPTGLNALRDCFISSSSLVRYSSGTNNFNNIQGSIIMNFASTVTTGIYQDVNSKYYDLAIAGTNPSGNGSLAQPFYRGETVSKAFNYATHRILYPTMNVNSISADPLFNNILSQDFTLQATSPMIGRASDGLSNIGGTKYAQRHTAKGSTFNSGAISVTNLTFLGNDYIVNGATNGEVVSAPIFHSNTTKIIQKITYNGLLEFNKALGAGPVVGNRNVPDQEVYDSTVNPPNVAGANPDRLVYYMRYSTQTLQPAIDAEWDNGGFWTAGNYNTFEWNTKPFFAYNIGATLYVGNGDPTLDTAAGTTFINATWIQLKVKLRNNYV